MAELLQEIQEIRRQSGDRPELAIVEASIWASAGKVDQAVMLLRRTVPTDKTVQSRMQLILLLTQQQPPRTAEAIEECRQLAKEHPAAPEGWLAMSRLLEEQGNIAEARSAMEQGIAAAGQAGSSLEVQLALLDLRHDRRADGLRRLEKLRGQNKQDFQLRSLMLEIDEFARDSAVADSLIEELKSIQGDGSVLWRYYRARRLAAQPDWRDKRETIDSLLHACRTMDPDWLAPALLLGELDEHEGNLERAAVVYQTAMKDNPTSIELAERLLNLLEKQKRFGEAKDVLDRLVGADPHRVADLRIRMALDGGDSVSAIGELRRRIAAGPKDASSRILLAQLLYAGARSRGRRGAVGAGQGDRSFIPRGDSHGNFHSPQRRQEQ